MTDGQVDAEQRYRLIAENAGDVVFETRPDATLGWVSPSVTEVLGWTPDQLAGRAARSLIHPDDLPAVIAGAEALLAGATHSTGRSRVVRPDGSYRWFAWTQRILGVAADEGTSRLTSMRDIQAEVEAEKALESSLAFYRLLADNASDVIVVLGPSGVVEWASPSAHRVFGWDPDAIVGTTDVDFVHPDDLERFTAEVTHHLEREATTGDELTFRLRCGDGTYLWVDAAWRLAPISTDGRHTRVVRLRDVDGKVQAFVALARSEERFRTAMRDAGIGMCLVALDGSIMSVNASLCEYLGKDENELMAHTWHEFVHPDDLEADQIHAQEIRDGHRDAYRLATRFVRSDGTTAYGDVSISGVRDATGQLDCIIAQVVDVTAQVESRAALAASEEHFRLLAENASDVVMRFTGQTIVWVSPSLVDALGWSPQDWIGTNGAGFFHPDDLAVQEANAVRILAGERALYRVRLRGRDGSYHWCEVHSRAYEENSGQIAGFIASFRVIDAEVAAQEAVTRSEELFRTAMDSAPTGMAVLDLDRHFLEVNPALCRMLDQDEDWLLDRRIVDILTPEDNEMDLRIRASVLSGHLETPRREKRLIRADGSLLWVEHSIGLLRDDEGIPRGYVSQFVNITDAREAREQLRFMATHDPMTRLVNRPELLMQMDRLLAHSPRTGTQMACLFIDLDGLKAVNDTHGHAVGDKVIVEVAERLRSQVRSGDLVARLGGDEFVVLLPAIHTIEDAERVAEKMHATVGEPMIIDHLTLSVSVSIGIALAATGDESDVVLDRADSALYRAKRTGRARTVTFDRVADEQG